ncbi:uncharacterized protein KY384_003092 [Bacidia gigantensis]|uniref:uncharacterized protein n=1 Tax=Bacidia gigantensis TaxID=2732470 RepID=UPI001D055010|nr:uncharacterized protein KY384_003092 [Bacidia gigantensis]KAG8531463.1 hypothetical protein KY384_003092 [Bacidia gigantensis]
MALVDYGSSGESGSEQDAPPQPASKPKTFASKHGFQKLVDSSNPQKIRVNLEQKQAAENKSTADDERPLKKARIEGGGLKDFNALLPSPKRPADAKGSIRGGLGRGVSLKTGATPGFTREPMPQRDPAPTDDGSDNFEGDPGAQDWRALAEDTSIGTAPHTTSADPAQAPVKKATMFKPLSVARKPQKKRPLDKSSEPSRTVVANVDNGEAAKPAPKISLFSSQNIPSDGFRTDPNMTVKKDYQPMLYQVSSQDYLPSAASLHPEESNTIHSPAPPAETNAPIQDQSLSSIATSLNLTPSQTRQLLGRNATKSSSAQAVKITNVNIDEEYASNEALRQAGETVQHNAVRPIQGGGKHSLKQLVNSAVGQKEALEEKFAEGIKNRKEGAGKYGW